MILVTVGTQAPFDRLVQAVDEWAAEEERTDVFAQIADSVLVPKHIAWEKFLTPEDLQQRLEAATLVISHAGIGTILSALRLRKPILILPRVAALGEQRNDHQLATARRFSESGIITAAYDNEDLKRQLSELDRITTGKEVSEFASKELISGLRGFFARGTS